LTLNNLCESLRKNKKYKIAEQRLNFCLENIENKKSVEFAICLGNMAIIQYCKSNFFLARLNILECIEIFSKHLHKGHKFVKKSEEVFGEI
jgi:hypothetical protein